MGQQTMDVKLEYRSLQTVLTALERENHSLQEEIAALKLENTKLCEQLQQLSSESRLQNEIQTLHWALEQRDEEIQKLKIRLAKRKSKNGSGPPTSTEEELQFQVEELEDLNSEKDQEIYSLKYQFMNHNKAWEGAFKEKNQEIRKLQGDLLEEVSNSMTARSQLEEKEYQILELKQLLGERSNRPRNMYPQGKQLPKKTGSSFPAQNRGQVTGAEGREVQGTSADEAAQFESRWPESEGQTEVSHSACGDTSTHSNNLVFQGYKVPEEDYTFRWKVCACDRDDCPTCVAEKAAVAQSARVKCGKCGKIHHRHHQNNKRPPQAKGEAEGEEEDEEETEEEEEDYYWGETEDPRQVLVMKEPQKATSPDQQQPDSKCFIYLFHGSIRDVTTYDHTCHDKERSIGCSSCSISALLFAHKYQTYPSGMDPDGVSNELFSQVLDSINEARESIRLNYEGRTEPLEPVDTLLLTSHLGLRLKEEIEPDAMLGLTLVPYIVHIEPGQILLFYRMLPYKVLSMVASEDGERILIFDPQWHWQRLGKSKKTKKRWGRWYGACLFSSVKEVEVIKDVLTYVEKYCDSMRGKCKLAILEKETNS